MARFEADFDPGEDDRMPEWVVIEWTFDNGEGCRVGRTIGSFYGKNAEVQAKEMAQILQEGYEQEIADWEASEFDSDYNEFPLGEFPFPRRFV